MADGVWQPLDFDEETAWLGGAASGGAVAGFDQDGWQASVWIAHAMFELPGMEVDYTHDDVSTVTGGQLGLVGRPSKEWVRVPWAELAVRLGASLDDQEFPPCFKWFPYRSWPASMEPPPEGSLDELSLHALILHLAAAGSSDECAAAYGLVAAGALEEAIRCFRGPIGRVQELIDRNEWRIGTPSNIWPLDRSWFVYTDWDLWGTKVSGSQSLIDQLIADPDLETLVWPRPDEART